MSTSKMDEMATNVNEDDSDASLHSDDDEHDDIPAQQEAEGSSSAKPNKKKKKKSKSKAAKALAALKGKIGSGDAIPQEIVDVVLEKVKEEHGENAEGADEETVRKALDYLKINDVLKGKAGVAGKGRKDMGGHKFWATQPVTQAGEGNPEQDGYIEESVPPEQVRQEPYPLPKEFEWSRVDITDAAQLTEVYELLSAHYVEDHDAAFRFKYTAPFLLWALKPPHFIPEWLIGVRVSSNKKLIAFISGVPTTIRVRDITFATVEINFLVVHKKLRSKRLTPVLIKEITRQCHLKGIFQAIYTGGVVLPTPVATCRYFHRPLNIPKLVEVKFTGVPRSMTMHRMIRLHHLADRPQIRGLREAEAKDLEALHGLFEKFMKRYDMAHIMNVDEVEHNFLSGRGKGEMVQGRREDQVIWTYVVENPETHKITDFFTLYTLPSTIIGSVKYPVLDACYLYYYASDVGIVDEETDESEEKLRVRLQELVGDALIIADQAKFDVFNCLTLMDNPPFLKDLKFGGGDGLLNFYLYNWRTSKLAGVNDEGDRKAGRGVGVVML